MSSDWLVRALEESRARGFLSPQPIDHQISHAEGFATAWASQRDSPPAAFLDLGSGGGLPGLVLAEYWATAATLLDAMEKRTVFLQEVLGWPGAPTAVTVRRGRAEELAREPGLEGHFDLVTARSFAPPAVTAECAVRYLRSGGLLLVSEPPEDLGRWPEAPLAALGLAVGPRLSAGAGFRVLEKVGPTPPVYPRKSGLPGKRPLF